MPVSTNPVSINGNVEVHVDQAVTLEQEFHVSGPSTGVARVVVDPGATLTLTTTNTDQLAFSVGPRAELVNNGTLRVLGRIDFRINGPTATLRNEGTLALGDGSDVPFMRVSTGALLINNAHID
ncbi:MAG: hypothetical protein ABR537_00660, partial [Gemmatimonadales bacterium]